MSGSDLVHYPARANRYAERKNIELLPKLDLLGLVHALDSAGSCKNHISIIANRGHQSREISKLLPNTCPARDLSSGFFPNSLFE